MRNRSRKFFLRNKTTMTTKFAISSAAEPEKRWIVPLFLAACLLIYPNRLLLFAPHWIIFAFSTASVSLLAMGLVLLSGRAKETFRTLPRFFSGAMILFLLIAGWHTLTHPGAYKLNDFARSVGYLTIPFFAFSFREELKKVLPEWMTIFWLFTILQSLTEGFLLDTDILAGLPMNINWNAALIAVTLPFVIFLILKRTADKKILCCALIAVSAGVSGYILWICHSYAVFFAIPCVLFFCAVMQIARNLQQKIIALLAAAAVAAGGILFYLGHFSPDPAKIDRVFFFRNTLKVIGDAPLFGHGIPSFAQAFLPYRTEDFFALEFAVDHINHPHNHFLFMAAGVGIIGLLAWLILLLVPYFKFSFCRFKDADAVERLVFSGFSLLLLHGMADLVLYQEPVNLLAWIFCGILWGNIALPEGHSAEEGSPQKTAKIPVIAGWFVAFLALLMALANLYASIHYRMGYRLAKDQPGKASVHFEHAMMFSSWDNQLFYQYPVAEFYLRHKLLDRTLEVLSRIGNSPEPDYAHVHLLRGRIFLQQKKYADAVKEFLREAELYPLHPEALMYIWSIAVRQNQAPVIREAANELNRRFEALLWDIHFNPEDPADITGSDIILLKGPLSDHKMIFRRLRELHKNTER